MKKEDTFIPVIVIVVNFSLEKWDGALTLDEMLNLPNELKKFVNNYKLNVFDYHDYSDFSVFKTEVRVIFEELKVAKEKDNMKKLFDRLKIIEADTAQLLEQLLNIKFDKRYMFTDSQGKERMEVCKAWEDNWKDGIAVGIEQGIEQTLFRLVCKKIKKNYTLDMIADDLEEDVEVIRPIYEKAKHEVK